MYRLTPNNGVIRVEDEANIPNNNANRDWIEYQQWLNEGNTPIPYSPPQTEIKVVTPRQARLALFQAGLLPSVEASVEQAGGETKITWEYATEVNRDDPLIQSIGQSLGLTEQQIDDLFTQAATL